MKQPTDTLGEVTADLGNGTSALEVLLRLRPFSINPLLSASDFINFCKKNGVRIGSEQLEFYDKIGIFHPLLRFRLVDLRVYMLDSQPWYLIRRATGSSKRTDCRGLRLPNHVVLLDEKDLAVQLLDSGYILDPEQTAFKPWPKIRGKELQHRAQSCYYSKFQLYQLRWVLLEITKLFDLSSWPELSAIQLAAKSREMRQRASSLMDIARSDGIWTSRIVLICQTISDRYFPQTQTDRRSLLISSSNPGWSWDEYCRLWDPHLVARLLQIEAEGLKQLHERLSLDAQSYDPMEDWYDLVTYVSVSAKEKLKGDASYAQFVYSMEHMIRLFYKDLTGESLYPPNEGYGWRADSLYGEGVTALPLKHMYFLTNRFHLNPSPKLILIVEGKGECEHFPRLVRAIIGAHPEVLSIDIRTVEGVSQAAGSREEQYTALSTFIDWHHSRNTIVMLALDNENDISAKVDKLLKKHSIFTKGRKVTKKDYIRLWNPCIEFGCFTDDQLASAMTTVASGFATFSTADITGCRAASTPGTELRSLFKKRTMGCYNLPKIELLGSLIDGCIGRLETGNAESEPLVEFLIHVTQIAGDNVFPITQSHHEDLQKTGYYGDLIKTKEQTKPDESGT